MGYSILLLIRIHAGSRKRTRLPVAPAQAGACLTHWRELPGRPLPAQGRRNLVQQARGGDGEDGGELFEDANAGIASAALKFAEIRLSQPTFEGNIFLSPLPFGTEHAQISGEPVLNVHALIAPDARFTV